MRHKKALILALFFGLQRLFAATLDVYTDTGETYVGQPVILTMRISGSKAVNRPELADIPGVQIAPQGQSRFVQSSFGSGAGGSSVTMEYTWRLMPLKTGKMTVPGFDLKMPDGTRLQSEEIEILVREPGPLEGYHLFLTTDAETVFPGIPVRVTLKWLFSSEVSRPDFTIPFLERNDIRIDDLPPPSSQSSDIYQFTVGSRKVYAVQSAEIYEGQQYASLSMSWDIYPENPGELDLQPVFLAFQRGVVDRQGRRGYQPAVIPSNPLSLQVARLPGEMDSFPGGILVADDTLDITAELSQTRVYPGDPLTLTLRIKGLVSPDVTDFRGVEDLNELKGIIRTDPSSLITETEGSDLLVSQSLRIETSSIDSFPSLSFPYYSLKRGAVRTAVSPPVGLEVLELEGGTIRPADSAGLSGGAGRTEAVTDSEGIALKGNRSSTGGSALFLKRYLMAAVLLILTVLLLLAPFIVKSAGSLRFGRRRADLRGQIKMALRAYKRDRVPEKGQRVYDLLLAWRDVNGSPGSELESLCGRLEESLWGAGGEARPSEDFLDSISAAIDADKKKGGSI